MTTSRLLILGGGTGGTLTANRLRRLYPVDELSITVVDQDDCHVEHPGLLFVPFGRSVCFRAGWCPLDRLPP